MQNPPDTINPFSVNSDQYIRKLPEYLHWFIANFTYS